MPKPGFDRSTSSPLGRGGIYVTTVSLGQIRAGSHLNALSKGKQKKEFALFSIAGEGLVSAKNATLVAYGRWLMALGR